MKKLISLCLIGLVIVLLPQVIFAQVPQPLTTCYPPEFQPPSETYILNTPQKTYYYLNATYKNTNHSSSTGALYFEVEPKTGTCKYLNPSAQSTALSAFIPMQYATELFRLYYKQRIDKVGLAKFQEALNEPFSAEPSEPGLDGTPTFFPEEAIALKQLGVQLPQNARIVRDYQEVLPNPPRTNPYENKGNPKP